METNPDTIVGELTTVFQDIDASRYFTYATLCLVIYDHGESEYCDPLHQGV